MQTECGSALPAEGGQAWQAVLLEPCLSCEENGKGCGGWFGGWQDECPIRPEVLP